MVGECQPCTIACLLSGSGNRVAGRVISKSTGSAVISYWTSLLMFTLHDPSFMMTDDKTYLYD